MMSGSVLLLLAVTAERLGELILARRNTAALKARAPSRLRPGTIR